MPNIQTPFAKRLAAADLTMRDLAWICNLPLQRVRDYSTGAIQLTPAELERVNAAIEHHAVCYSVYQRTVEDTRAVVIQRVKNGTLSVTAAKVEAGA